MKLYIRNMFCESCKIVVKHELEKHGIAVLKVEPGIAEIKKKMTDRQLRLFSNGIKKAGLELVKRKEEVLVDEIKNAVAEYIHNNSCIETNLSDFLCNKLNYEYAYLSSHFSAAQNRTIEQFMIHLKIEKVKELLTLYDMTLTQIAYKLNYSSVAHLSHQFKKVTGISATQFRSQHAVQRKTIQEL